MAFTQELFSIITPIQVDGAHILVLILRVQSSDSARTLHVPYICFGTYYSWFGKSARYDVEMCVRTCLALVHRHLRLFIVIGISFRAIFCPREWFVNILQTLWIFPGEPSPFPSILFVYRIVLFYLQYLPQTKKSLWERIESLQTGVNLMISLVAIFFVNLEGSVAKGRLFRICG